MSEARVQLGPGKMSKEMARSKQRRWNYSSLAHQRTTESGGRAKSKSERQAKARLGRSGLKTANPRLHPDDERILQLVDAPLQALGVGDSTRCAIAVASW